ncbi:MAG: peptidyl-prolyl cis-trans isomerase [Victivallaceae bacterium]|nr:peptidyl-prolyl cis-trans isomerase [Victivallaceae bacterium]
MTHKFTIFIIVSALLLLISGLIVLALKEEQQAKQRVDVIAKRIGDDVVATYAGGEITAQELRGYINKIMPRQAKHTTCKKHGSDHKKCSRDEGCESHPLDSPETYRLLLQRLVTEKMLKRWISEKGMLSRKDVTHKLKHLVEEINLNVLSGEMHSDKLKPDQVEMRQYYEQRRDEYQSRSFAEVEQEIEQTLIAQKQAEYIPKYIEELKKNAVIERNYELLKVVPPTDSEIKSYYAENQRKYTRAELLRINYMVFQNGADKKVQARAQKALVKIRAGGDFKKIADKLADSSAKSESVERNSRTKSTKFIETMFRYQQGETTPVFKDGKTLYIAEIVERQGSEIKSLDEVRGEVKKVVYLAKERQKMEQNKYDALFSIQGKRFTVEQFMEEFDELTPQQQQQFASFKAKKNLLDQLVVKELLIEKAEDKSQNNEARAYREKMKLTALKQMLHKEEVDEEITISDKQVKEFYDDYKSRLIEPQKAQISIIRVGIGFSEDERKRGRAKIEAAQGKLRTGADFAATAKKYSEDWSASRGGKLDRWILEGGGHLAERYEHGFHRYVFALTPGAVSDFFEFQNNYWIIKMRQLIAATPQTLEQAKPQIVKLLRAVRHQQRTNEMQNKLLEKSQLVIRDFVLTQLMGVEARAHAQEKNSLHPSGCSHQQASGGHKHGAGCGHQQQNGGYLHDAGCGH